MTATDVLARLLKPALGSRLQRTLTEAVGVSLTAYQHYEADRRKPDIDMLREIAADGWDLDWLITGMGNGMRRQYAMPVPSPLGVANEPGATCGATAGIDTATSERAKRIVLLAADPLDPKPALSTFAEAVAAIVNSIAGRPYNYDDLPGMLDRAKSLLLHELKL